MLIDIVDSTDVGVSDPARQAKLPAEAFHRAFVGREAGAQRLQGDVFVTQDEVFGFVHFAHSALSEQTDDSEPFRNNLAIRKGSESLLNVRGRENQIGKLRKEVDGGAVVVEELLHLNAQLRISNACSIEQFRPLGEIEPVEPCKELLDPFQPSVGFVVHDPDGEVQAYARSRAKSHACAAAHCRSTVRSEIPRTSPISLEFMPAKKRSSTIRL